MKKIFLKGLFSFPLFIIIISAGSCSDPEPSLVYQAEYLIADPLVCIPIVVCPNAGNNCSNTDPHPAGFRDDQVAMINTFYRMCKNDSARQFFDMHDWRTMLPEFNSREEMISKVISGDFKVKMMGDSSIVIVSSEELHSANIVFAYNLDRAAPCY